MVNFKPHLKNLIILLAGALLFFTFISLPEIPTIKLDSSFQHSYGVALKNNLQNGVDIILTFGPLGYFYFSPFDKELFWPKIFWEIIIKLFMVITFIEYSYKLKKTREKIAFLTGLFLFAPLVSLTPNNHFADPLFFLSIVAFTICTIDQPEKSFSINNTLKLLVIVLISMVKFTFFILAIVSVLVIAIIHVKNKKPGNALTMIGLFAFFFVACWSLLGQSPLNIPNFILSSFEIASGYSEAMMIMGPGSEIILGLAIISLALIFICLSFLIKPEFKGLMINAYVITGLFLSWKAGLVRHDAHSFILFYFAILTPFFLYTPLLTENLSKYFLTIRVLMILLSVAGLFLYSSKVIEKHNISINTLNQKIIKKTQNLYSLNKLNESLISHLEKFKKNYSLPRIKKEVKNETIDMISYHQEWLFLNELNWQPRPIIQSHSTYTSSLLLKNADYFSGDKAPKYIMFMLQPLGNRFPTQDDAEALKVISRNYRPVLLEKTYLLLKQSKNQEDDYGSGKELFNRKISFFEKVDISSLKGDYHIASIDIEYSLLGRIRKFFYKSPIILMKLNADSNKQFIYSIVPGMSKSGFILNPLILTQKDFVSFIYGVDLPKVTSFQIGVKKNELKYFKPTISVKIVWEDSLLYRKVEKLSSQGRINEAMGKIQEALKIDPENSKLRFNLWNLKK